MLKLEARPQASKAMSIASPLLALAITVVIGVVLFIALGKDPVRGLQVFFWEPVKSGYALGELAMKATPLLLIALGLAVCFRSNVWNIGAEGQFILGAFGMQKMVDYVAERSFPQLERRRGGGAAGSVGNGLLALFGMVGLFIVSIPLWILPPLWPLIPLAILSWVNQRLLRYDALAEHADREEMARLFRERRGGLYALGIMLALLAYVPFVNFIGPVVFGLAFIRYLLGALEAIRSGYRADPNKELAGGNAAP